MGPRRAEATVCSGPTTSILPCGVDAFHVAVSQKCSFTTPFYHLHLQTDTAYPKTPSIKNCIKTEESAICKMGIKYQPSEFQF